MRIGLISDTHGWIHPSLFDHFKGCNEIWHTGDIGNIQTAGLLYINPGAAGITGFHKYMTAIRFRIDDKNIHDLELMEMGERGKIRL